MKERTFSKYIIDAFQFKELKGAYALSELLKINFSPFIQEIEKASYTEFTIPKSTGGKRTIEAPNENILFIQKRLNHYLQAVYYSMKPDAVYGFVPSVYDGFTPKTIITNAENHLNKKYLLNIDLKDFFHSISANAVRKLFLAAHFNFSEDLSTCIALICCWKKRLPMGAATSPVLSNLYCLPLDQQLIDLAEKYRITYTRYADDLTFSSDVLFTEELISEIRKCIHDAAFTINERKFRMQSSFKKQSVTGIKVNVKTNVDRRYIRNIRAALHDIKQNGIEKASLKYYKLNAIDERMVKTLLLSIRGKVNFIGQVRGADDVIYQKLQSDLSAFLPISKNKNKLKKNNK
jgi:RNA-directed DNA polymerase